MQNKEPSLLTPKGAVMVRDAATARTQASPARSGEEKWGSVQRIERLKMGLGGHMMNNSCYLIQPNFLTFYQGA